VRYLALFLLLFAATPTLAQNSSSPRCVRELPRAGQLLFRADSGEANSRSTAKAERCSALRGSMRDMSESLRLIRGCMTPTERAEGGNYEYLLSRQKALGETYVNECARRS
jgi:hypothetical protein